MARASLSLSVGVVCAVALLSCIASASRPHPEVRQIMLTDVAAPQARDSGGIREDLSRMNCAEAQLYVMDIERRFSTSPIDLEKVCVSLKGALKGGIPKCPSFKPAGTFGKLFKVCKVVTNEGSLTCTSVSDCGTAV